MGVRAAIAFALLCGLGEASAFACGTIQQAREAYEKGDVDAARITLRCLKTEHPDDLDVRRLYSDILWWEGDQKKSVFEAVDGLQLADEMSGADPFDERRMHFLDRISTLKLDGNASAIQSDNHSGVDAAMEADYRYSLTDHALFGVYRTSRTYTGDVNISDWRVEGGQVWAISKTVYLESRLEYSPDPVISAQWSVAETPHWVLTDGSDVSLGAKWSHYTTDPVYMLSPAWSRVVFDRFFVGLQEYDIFTYHWLFAGEGFLEYAFSPRVSVRGNVADGSAVEGPGLEGWFRSFGVGASYRVRPNLALVPNVGVYNGELRKETSAGIGVEWKL